MILVAVVALTPVLVLCVIISSDALTYRTVRVIEGLRGELGAASARCKRAPRWGPCPERCARGWQCKRPEGHYTDHDCGGRP